MPETTLQNQTIVVVGAGIAGLAAAHALRRRGATIVVVEAADRVGGRIETDRSTGLPIDLGAQFVGTADDALQATLHEAAISLPFVDPLTDDALVTDSRVHRLTYGSPTALITTGALGTMTKLRLAARIFPAVLQAPKRLADAGRWDTETVARFIERAAGEQAYQGFTAPLLSTFYRLDGRSTSLALALTSARTSGDATPQALAAGLAALPEALAAPLDVRCKVEVTSVHDAGEYVRVETGTGPIDAAACVVAVPGSQAPTLVPSLSAAARAWFDQRRYGDTAAVAVICHAPMTARHTSYTYADTTRLIGTLVVMNNKIGRGAADRGIVIGYPTLSRTADLLALDTETAAERLVAECRREVPELNSAVEHAIVRPWLGSVPQFPPGVVAQLAAFTQLDLPPRLAFAGDYLAGPTIDAAVRSGRAAAYRIARALGGEHIQRPDFEPM